MDNDISPYNRNTAIWLCICLGWFGAHRIFLDRNSGALQIALSVAVLIMIGVGYSAIGIALAALLGLWICRDAVLLAANRFEDAKGRRVAQTPKIVRKQESRQAGLEHQILSYLEDQGGLITEIRTAVYVKSSVEAVRDDLKKMIEASYIEPRITKDGKMVYVCEELLTSENRRKLEPI